MRDENENIENDEDAQLQKYLDGIEVSEDNPGLVLSWNLQSLDQFCFVANGANNLPQPDIRITSIGNLSTTSLVTDLSLFLFRISGTRYYQAFPNQSIVFAPNTPQQFGELVTQIMRISTDPFVKAAMRLCGNNMQLGGLGFISDKMKLSEAIPYVLNSDVNTGF